MYKLVGTQWQDQGGRRVSAQDVSNYLQKQSKSPRQLSWNWFSFILGLVIGAFGLSIAGFIGNIIGWSFSRIGVVLEGLLALIIILVLLGAIAWLVLLLKSKWMNLNKQPGKSSGDQKTVSLKQRLRTNVQTSTGKHTEEVKT